MNAAAASSKFRLFPPNLVPRGCFFCTLDLRTENRRARAKEVRARGPEAEELKENWLASLSCPFLRPKLDPSSGINERDEEKWVLGIDPDASGALALLKVVVDDDDDASCCSAQVFDTPHLQVLVGKRVRKRLDARSIVQLLHSFGAPLGTTAYIEQSSPFPQDGKQGWWSGGFAYGLWIGTLVSSGFSVVPVSSRLWKDHFQLSRNSSSKDDSRKAASDLFPSLSSSLKRKKDHVNSFHTACLQAELKLFLLLPMERVLGYNQNQLLLHLVRPQYQHYQWKIDPQKSNFKVMKRNQTILKYYFNISAAFNTTRS